MDENQIITAVRQGDTDQYALLVERYWIGLVIHCERLLGDRAGAEDVAQKSFIKAYNQLAQFDTKRAHFSTWLYRIARNTALDTIRSDKHYAVLDESSLESLDPEQLTFEQDELIGALRSAVADLKPNEQRRVIEAYYWQGKSYQTIADEMHVPINTVKTWIRRAKQQLRSALL
jgi:RNA polymerase sigma-70 factor (ECF subfamily)